MPNALGWLVLMVAGWLNRRQEDLIDDLREENRVLREQLEDRRLRLTDAQRRRLAVRAKKLGRRALREVAGIVTPDTILRWYRQLIAKKYDGSGRRGRGRAMTPAQVAELVVRMAVDNPRWGCTRIRGALGNLRAYDRPHYLKAHSAGPWDRTRGGAFRSDSLEDVP